MRPNFWPNVLFLLEYKLSSPAYKTSSSHKNTEGFNNLRNDIILGSTEDPSNCIESQFLRFFYWNPLGPLQIKNRSKNGLICFLDSNKFLSKARRARLDAKTF